VIRTVTFFSGRAASEITLLIYSYQVAWLVEPRRSNTRVVHAALRGLAS